MGGLNQATSIPSDVSVSGVSTNPIRFHENPAKGEAHFHDDINDMKCAVKFDEFVKAYSAWRQDKKPEDLYLLGHDGHGSHAAVRFHTFLNKDKLDVAISIEKVSDSDTLKALDVLALF